MSFSCHSLNNYHPQQDAEHFKQGMKERSTKPKLADQNDCLNQSSFFMQLAKKNDPLTTSLSKGVTIEKSSSPQHPSSSASIGHDKPADYFFNTFVASWLNS